MSINLEALVNAVAAYHERADDAGKRAYFEASQLVINQIQESLPALTQDDQAAVAYYIGGILSAIRELPMKDAGDLITDNAVGYTLASARLYGML